MRRPREREWGGLPVPLPRAAHVPARATRTVRRQAQPTGRVDVRRLPGVRAIWSGGHPDEGVRQGRCARHLLPRPVQRLLLGRRVDRQIHVSLLHDGRDHRPEHDHCNSAAHLRSGRLVVLPLHAHLCARLQAVGRQREQLGQLGRELARRVRHVGVARRVHLDCRPRRVDARERGRTEPWRHRAVRGRHQLDQQRQWRGDLCLRRRGGRRGLHHRHAQRDDLHAGRHVFGLLGRVARSGRPWLGPARRGG